jgi:organic hydroperoxide reductase OsmC/OhrA
MTTYHATIRWSRGDAAFADQKYSRGHRWEFDEGISVPASAAPHAVRAPWSVAAAVDPEEALVAAVSSCHMLFVLSYVSRDGFIAESYLDAAVGEMGKNAEGKVAILKVTLRPRLAVSGSAPSAAQFAAWHHTAHEECYIANSLRSDVVVEPELIAV